MSLVYSAENHDLAVRARSGRLRGEVRRVAALAPATVDDMWQVFSHYYTDVSRRRFQDDLAHKSEVILLRDSGDGSLQGFSTIEVSEKMYQGKRALVVFTGDTVIEQSYWGQGVLPRIFSRRLSMIKLRNPRARVYWLLISKGYKTYLLLTRNVPEHWPRHDRATPPAVQQLLDEVAGERFGASYKPERGVLHFERRMGRLKSSVAPIRLAQLEVPDIRFFVERNPGHIHGDELCCLGHINAWVWLHVSARMLTQPLRRWRRRWRRRQRRAGQGVR
ncbi:hypothetical protein [Haliangium ochraceum]|uniref:Uncharacterized protein n=1 Tax=Haliangium ochraceum (strain DSM 14365 / JCM 11303 / SMP-2) TaxID=502025 RepID=D0LSN4_HALO1|nr:hypothetical protein [Haliangium ochraceum]ACY17256.1 conserved hypothetical protein [Haliangium ochraceum DSM 14365]